MKKYILRTTDKAKQDFSDLTHYSLITFGEFQAYKYLLKFEEAYDKLSKFPTIGHSRKDLTEGLRAMTIGQHTLIYSINEKDQSILVIRILHARMNFSDKI